MFQPEEELVEPQRVFLKQGTLMKVSRKEVLKRHFFLFNDILIYAKPIGVGLSALSLSQKLELERMKVEKNPDDACQFTIQSAKKSFVCVADTPEERDAWVFELQSGIDKMVQKKQSFHLASGEQGANDPDHTAPVWVPDSQAKNCKLCSVGFTVINRRHHCRDCGEVVCGGCSNRKAVLRKGDKPERVCDRCYQKHQAAPQ
eukprot:TRINITY_DN2212_c0_g1_i1.p1 TRINITY_DN2212_c0_g1~~TRINITY_DN2212_c0_g1_i1.p1  ORF type:complete len:202 (-),score=42.28 TRINITY_DN2212_c0_g1_i1:31-636(-)